jgi:hypothetical protein
MNTTNRPRYSLGPATVKGLQVYPDFSGAPCTVWIAGFVFRFDTLAGEIRRGLVGGPSGVSRTLHKLAIAAAEKAYLEARAEAGVNEAWLEGSRALYRPEIEAGCLVAS